MKRLACWILAVGAVLVMGSCAGKASHDEPVLSDLPSPVSPQVPDTLYRETGMASWYGRDFQGRTTASGEIFDMNSISAAHRTLPLGTVLSVTNLDNFKSIKVRINDRGPFVKGRVLELSFGAAKELGFASQGTARVKLESLEAVRDPAVFTVQAAAFAEEDNARTLKTRLQRKYETVYIVSHESNVSKFYRVRVGAYTSEEKAERVAGKLTLDGLEPVVVRKD
ncbi:MAG: septal ring lytic transglycosylase RlpA family protein [Nitrospirota bacterium]